MIKPEPIASVGVTRLVPVPERREGQQIHAAIGAPAGGLGKIDPRHPLSAPPAGPERHCAAQAGG